MVADLNHEGCLQFYGGFWARVRKDLACAPIYLDSGAVVPGALVRASTLAWLLSDALTYDDAGNPVSFRAWCRFGGINLDPAWFREELLAGRVPVFLKYEDA